MIRWFRRRSALIKELHEYQTAFDALTASFARHRKATGDRAVAQQHRIDVLEQAIDRMRPAGGMARVANQPMVWQDACAIAQETAAKRKADGEGDE